jgi:hypothetical protein
VESALRQGFLSFCSKVLQGGEILVRKGYKDSRFGGCHLRLSVTLVKHWCQYKNLAIKLPEFFFMIRSRNMQKPRNQYERSSPMGIRVLEKASKVVAQVTQVAKRADQIARRSREGLPGVEYRDRTARNTLPDRWRQVSHPDTSLWLEHATKMLPMLEQAFPEIVPTASASPQELAALMINKGIPLLQTQIPLDHQEAVLELLSLNPSLLCPFSASPRAR